MKVYLKYIKFMMPTIKSWFNILQIFCKYLYYVLEDLTQDLSGKVGSNCSVLGRVRIPKNNEKIENNEVRLFVNVNKIVFADKSEINTETAKKESDSSNTDVKDKDRKKADLRAEINAKLKTRIMFDVVKGKVSSVERTDKNGNKYIAYILTDDFNDQYMLYKKGADLSVLNGKEVACLGRQIISPNNMYVVVDESVFKVVDESVFKIYKVYDANYKKLV